jgi:polar amino acid transport system permease protein
MSAIPTGAWDWAFAWSILPQLLSATVYSVFATVLAFVGALVVGLPLALARDSHNRSLRLGTGALVELVRSTPILIQVYVLYFVLPTVGIVLPALVVGVMALALHYGTYVSEAYRAGIASVSQGQRNAAAALGLSPRDAFFLIVLPQAVPPIVPALGNYLIALFKETPLLSAIAIVELLQTAKLIGSETFRYNEPITLVGLILLALSLVSAALVRRAERWANRWR